MSTAEDYYRSRWQQERQANRWALHRAVAILGELAKLDIQRPRVLDLGCGTGWLTEILAQFGSAVGVDLAPEAAREFHPQLEFLKAGSELPRDFDVVVSQEVIEHAEDQTAYVQSAYEALKPGGFLILTTPNANVSRQHPEFLIQPTEKHLTGRQLRVLLEPRFEVRDLYTFFFGYARLLPVRLQMRFGRHMGAGLHLMAICRRTT